MPQLNTSNNASHTSLNWQFLNLSRKFEAEWFETLDSSVLYNKGLRKTLIKQHLRTAQNRAFQQLVSALVLENMLPEDCHIMSEGRAGEKRILLGIDHLSLLIQQNRPVYVGLFRSYESIILVQGKDIIIRKLDHPAELIDILAFIMGPEHNEHYLRLLSEITNSFLNDALCSTYREHKNRLFEKALTTQENQSFWQWLLNSGEYKNITLFLEQWSSVGHPYHPIRKAKESLSPSEVVSLSPEFNASILVRLAAVRNDRVHVETSTHCENIEKYMQNHFPVLFNQWRKKLTALGYAPHDYIPIPVHPWQAEHILEPFRKSQANDDTIPFINGPEFPAAPTMSFRTVVPMADTESPHVKLAMGLRLTSVPRTISPRSCQMGPRISDLLLDILSKDRELGKTIEIVPEQIGIHFQEADEKNNKIAKNLACIFRKNIFSDQRDGEVVIPAAALTVPCPGSGLPMFFEIFSKSDNGTLEQIHYVFRKYLNTLLGGLLRLFLVYGIALEAHQQNTLVKVSRSGNLQKFLFRDFGGIRIHQPTLFSKGFTLKLHTDRLTVVDNWTAIRNKLMIAAYHYHIGYMTTVFAEHFLVDDWVFWADVADVTKNVFTQLKTEVSPELWEQEYNALLNAPWIIKTSTRMRLLASDRDTYTPFENPMKSALEYRHLSSKQYQGGLIHNETL